MGGLQPEVIGRWDIILHPKQHLDTVQLIPTLDDQLEPYACILGGSN